MSLKHRTRSPPTTRNIPELGILQSIFRSASRRETLGRHSKGRRRGGGLKMGWTKPRDSACLCVLIAGWISGEDLKRPDAVGVGDCRDSLRGLQWAITASGDNICPLENVRNELRASTAPVAWPRQACGPQFNLHPKIVLFIMRYP